MDNNKREVKEMSQWIKDLEVTGKREDGKLYKTTIGNQEEDAKIQAEKLERKRLLKEKLKKWSKKWLPRLAKLIAIIGAIYIAYMFLYVLAIIFFGGVMMMAVGSGVKDAGQQSQRQARYYNELNRRRNRGQW